MLSTCLEAAYQFRIKREKDLKEEMEGRKTTELLLSLKTEQLQKQLKEEKEKKQKLEERVEMMLMQAPHPPDIAQIRKLIVSPEEWDGNIWGDPDNDYVKQDNPLYPPLPLNPPEYEARPIIKTEETTGPRGGAGDCTRKTTPFDPIQMANLQECYGHKPGETETEYLWRVCLTGRHRILLNGDEANGFWGPGVFLNAGPTPPDNPHSITSRVAYWAGGIDVLERGEPLLIPIKSLNELSTAITKAACIQAMHERSPLNVPISAIVDPDVLKPLIKGAPAMLKPYLIAKRDEIRRHTDFNALLAIREAADDEEEALVQRNLPTWATLMHDIINHGQEMGWDDLSDETKKTSRNVRQLKQSTQDNPPVQEPTDHQSKTQK
ncbi:uncharacterized protein ACIBXB_006056 [Morphnus guianensis]